MKKRMKPSMHEELQEMQFEGIEGYRNDDCLFCNQDIHVHEVQKEFYECRFQNVHIDGMMHACLFADVIFDHCDLSNCDLSECVFRRCEFHNCRMTGVDLSICTFQDVLLQESQCMYANLNGTNWKNSEWMNTLLQEASLHDLKWNALIIHECDFSGCEIMHTSLNELDLRTSLIEGIAVDPNDLKGCIVNVQQALSLAQLLGIVIKE